VDREAAPMSRMTVAVLGLLVVLLGLVAWREFATERREQRENDVRLFEGVDPARVVRLRVENLVRDQHLVFERGADGRWTMTDPWQAPADQNLLNHLFQTALDRRGSPVPEAGASAADLGLDPPRVLLEMEEAIDGKSRRTRVELGAIDLDNAHMSVRAGGRFLRTWRDLDTTLDHGLEDFLEHRVVDISPLDVVEVHRRGRLAFEPGAPPTDVSFDAMLEDGSWRLTSPYEAAIDPQGGAILVQGLCLVKMESYADFGQRVLADFGLDPAELTIALGTLSGRTFAIRFGRPGHEPGARWYATVEGRKFVWTIDGRAVERYAAPVEEFLDHAISRIKLPDADALSMVEGGRELRLWKERANELEQPVWKVAERPRSDAAFSPAAEADRRKVEDLLTAVARTEILEFRAGEALAESEVRGSVVVQSGDLRQGGQFGAEIEGKDGDRLVRFRRIGDSVVSLVPVSLVALGEASVDDLRSRILVEAMETEQRELRLAGSGRTRRFVRGPKGLWTRPGIDQEAKELHAVLDGLMIVRASEHLPPQAEPLVDPVEIVLTSQLDMRIAFVIGFVPEAEESRRVQFERDGRRAVLQDQDLYTRLQRILESD
jgi:hypothetical protein